MNKVIAALCLSFLCGQLWAENITGENRLLCASNSVLICVEDGECFDVPPRDLDVPQFIIVDTRKNTLSTTAASGEKRSTTINGLEREEGRVYLQGIEGGRAFSFVIEEDSGAMSAAVAHEGLTVSVFGACTSANVE